MQASVDAAPGLSSCGSWALEHRLNRTVVAHGLSCPEACGIFPDQGLNPCFLHWQADSLPLSHQGSPGSILFAILRTSWIWMLVFLPKLGKFSAIIFSNKISTPFSRPLLGAYKVKVCLVLSHKLLKPSSQYSFFFSFCCSNWAYSIALSVSWLHVVCHCGEGSGTPLQYSCLENPMDGGACWAAVYGVAQSRTRLRWLSSSSSLLLNPFSVSFSSAIVFFGSLISTWYFLIFFLSLCWSSHCVHPFFFTVQWAFL